MNLRTALTLCCATTVANSALAQRVSVDPFVAAGVTWTNNANLAPSPNAESDVILEVSPGIAFSVQGERLKVLGTLILDGLYYVEGNQRDRILPYANVDGNYEVLRDFLYLSGGVVTYRTAENPFAIRSIGPTTDNIFTTSQYRISPYIESTIGREVRYGVRSDNIWTHNSGGETTSVSDGYLTLNRAYIDRTPLPLGGGLSVEYQKSGYDDSNLEGLTQTLVRGAVRFGFATNGWVGVRGGYEDVEYATTDESGPIYGIEFSWKPGPRTSFEGFWEHRFFGSAWQAALNWGGVRSALNLTASRKLSTYSEQLFYTPASNVAQSLDAALSTQIVDPLERAREVRNIFSNRGLSTSLPRAVDIYQTQVNLLSDVNVTASSSLPRTSVALTGYYRKTVPAPGFQALVAPGPGTLPGVASTNSEQFGASFNAGYLLSPLLAINGLAAWTRIEGINDSPAITSTQMSYRLALIRQLSPRTAGNIGVRFQTLSSDIQADTRETAAFVGILHRF